MPVTPIQRLNCALKARPQRERQRIARQSGAGLSALGRVLAGRQINPNAYLKLCAGLGIAARTGEPVPVRKLGPFDWKFFGLGFRLTRNMKGLRTVRQASKAIGDHVSPATISRVENNKPISINGLIAICEFMGVDPEHYCGQPEKLHVKRISETTEGRAA